MTAEITSVPYEHDGKPAVMAGYWGSHLGVIDLNLKLDGDRWRVAQAHVEVRPIARRDASGAAQFAARDRAFKHAVAG